MARMSFDTAGQLVAVRDAVAEALPVTERDILRQVTACQQRNHHGSWSLQSFYYRGSIGVSGVQVRIRMWMPSTAAITTPRHF